MSNWFSSELKRLTMIDECEDPLRKTKKKEVLRLDEMQQLDHYSDAHHISAESHRSFLRNFWAQRTCAVLDPTALPSNITAALLPKDIQNVATPAVREAMLDALIDVLVLAG
eukprot:CAMPEP_0172924582 /NCGR_PEP_ID=MMETSP1075-20121228/211982_1 /TAXON_ID=2916 /ORGANISM="Ceratium fusus, Strain PA161109" /LENGTH=111 /DNA_ID=CAMNT_0013785275 /DNA_START=17 /DNA_END=349 /DNA_ORIENTATION=+